MEDMTLEAILRHQNEEHAAEIARLTAALARKVIAAERLVEALQVARDNEDIEGMFFALAAWEAAQ